MGRGRSRRRPGVLGGASPTDARRGSITGRGKEAWADPDLPGDLPGLLALVDDHLRAHLREFAQEQVALVEAAATDPTRAGDVPAPLHGEHPLFQAAAALRVLDPNDPRVRELLEQMLHTQQSDVRAFEDAMRDPKVRQVDSDVFRRYGLDELTGDKMRTERDRIIEKLREFAAQIAAHLNHDAHLGRFETATRAALTLGQRTALNRVLSRILRTGTPPECLAELVDHFELTRNLVRMRPLDQATLDDLSAYARFAHIAEREPNWYGLLTSRDTREMQMDHTVRNLRDWTRDSWGDGHNDMGWVARMVKGSADDAVATAHALLRDPRAGTHERLRPDLGLRVCVAVSERAFAALVERYAHTPGWGGVSGFTLTREQIMFRTGEHAGESVPGHHSPPSPRHVYIGAAACLDAVVDGRPVSVRFMLSSGQTTARSPAKHARLIDEHLAELGDERLGVSADGTPQIGVWDGTLVRSQRRGAGPRVPGRVALLGPDVCAHEGAEWVPVRGRRLSGLPPYLRLSCRRCLRHQVVSAPAHRDLDACEHIIDDDYVTHFRAHAAFNGERIGDDTTLSDLVARDAHISMNPAAYTTGTAGPGRTGARRRAGVLGSRRPVR